MIGASLFYFEDVEVTREFEEQSSVVEWWRADGKLDVDGDGWRSDKSAKDSRGTEYESN